MKTIGRLGQYLAYKKRSLRSVDAELGVGNGYLGKQLKADGSISSDILEKLFSMFPDLSPEWLLTEKGKMIRPGMETDVGLEIGGEAFEPQENLKQILLDMQKRIAELEKQTKK